jgi:NAD(P)-dependent dehydrogenase (short-subunit alcohol dehydrogenase family)
MAKRRIGLLGGCGGIGRALVAACLGDGQDVAVLDLKSSLARHPPPSGTVAIEIDGSVEASVMEAFENIGKLWGALDGFVNAAGFLITKQDLARTSASEFDSTIDGNLRTAFLCCKAATALLERGEGPSLVNIASGLGGFIRPQYGPYAMAKAGMIALTKTLALEHAPRIRANTVAPGPVDTAFLRGGTGRSTEDKPVSLDIAAYNAIIPLKRVATPDDIVGPVMFLLGPQSAYMTGQTLWVNGGAYMP